jgi:hypothetical protein
MGLHPSELFSSRVAVRCLQRPSPHVVRCNRQTCLSDEPTPSSKSQRRSVRTRRQRRAPFTGSDAETPAPPSNARRKPRTPSRTAEAVKSVIRHPNAESRFPGAETPASRSSAPDARPTPSPAAEAPDPFVGHPLQRPTPKPDAETPSPSSGAAPHRTPRSRRRNGVCPTSSRTPEPAAEAPASCARFEHRPPGAETPRTRRPSGAEAPEEPSNPRRRNAADPPSEDRSSPGLTSPSEASPPSGVCSPRESATPRGLFRSTEARSSPGLSTLQGFPPRDNGPAFTAPPLMGFLSSNANGR